MEWEQNRGGKGKKKKKIRDYPENTANPENHENIVTKNRIYKKKQVSVKLWVIWGGEYDNKAIRNSKNAGHPNFYSIAAVSYRKW